MLRNTMGMSIVPRNTLSFLSPARVSRNFTTKSNLNKIHQSRSYPASTTAPKRKTSFLGDHSVVPSTRSCPYSTSTEESSTFSSNYKKFNADFNERQTQSSSPPSLFDPTKTSRSHKPRKPSGKPLAIGSVVAYSPHSASRNPRIRSTIVNKHRPRVGHFTPPLAANPALSHGKEDDNEPISESTRILVESMQEANVTVVRHRPPVFLCSTYEQAELAMELFTTYNKTISGGQGPVGFDTETTTSFVPRTGSGVSLVQIATHDICLMFQVFRITKNNTQSDLFPPRLKAFLEDPEQLMAGVASLGDAKVLKSSYGIQCEGVISLDELAKKKGILARSLASLDEMYGRPGREVVKTKSMLGWNWDKEVLDPKWVWYAAKDAFAGLAIYDNLLKDKRKESFKPYHEKYPKTEMEIAYEIKDFLLSKAGITGWQYRGSNERFRMTVASAHNILVHNSPRILKTIQPEDREEKTMNYLQMLLDDGKLCLAGDKPTSEPLKKTDIIYAPGKSLASIMEAPEGIDILSPYFSGKRIDPSTLSKKYISVNYETTVADQDEADLKLFLELSWVWEGPRKPSALIGIYGNAKSNAIYWKTYSDAIQKEMEDKGHKDKKTAENAFDKKSLPKIRIDHEEAAKFWKSYQQRLIQRGVIRKHNGVITIDPSIEKQLLNKIQSPGESPAIISTPDKPGSNQTSENKHTGTKLTETLSVLSLESDPNAKDISLKSEVAQDISLESEAAQDISLESELTPSTQNLNLEHDTTETPASSKETPNGS
ncbi:hypothetical protein BGZ76_009189 [Entomortierella beljakovae]|nr:hypothetical protein BGZ76_009189 [Entomortierella beljakovae]